MGHGNSKAGMESSSDESARGDGSSRADRIKKKLHLSRSHFRRHHRHAGATVSSAHNLTKLLKEEDFAGIALLRLITVFSVFKFLFSSFYTIYQLILVLIMIITGVYF